MLLSTLEVYKVLDVVLGSGHESDMAQNQFDETRPVLVCHVQTTVAFSDIWIVF